MICVCGKFIATKYIMYKHKKLTHCTNNQIKTKKDMDRELEFDFAMIKLSNFEMEFKSNPNLFFLKYAYIFRHINRKM